MGDIKFKSTTFISNNWNIKRSRYGSYERFELGSSRGNSDEFGQARESIWYIEIPKVLPISLIGISIISDFVRMYRNPEFKDFWMYHILNNIHINCLDKWIRLYIFGIFVWKFSKFDFVIMILENNRFSILKKCICTTFLLTFQLTPTTIFAVNRFITVERWCVSSNEDYVFCNYDFSFSWKLY